MYSVVHRERRAGRQWLNHLTEISCGTVGNSYSQMHCIPIVHSLVPSMCSRNQPGHGAYRPRGGGMIHQCSLASPDEKEGYRVVRNSTAVPHRMSYCQRIRMRKAYLCLVPRLPGGGAEDERATDLSPTADVWPEVHQCPSVREGKEA